MKQSGSGAVRLLLLLALLVVAAAVSYWKVKGTRDFVDQKMPFVKETLTRFGAAPADPADPATDATPSADGSAPPAPAKAVTFESLAADPTSWPRTVRLKRAVEIPAVVDGREKGKVTVNAGTEVKLARIKDGKVGIEYQGGGAWLTPDETDLMERVRPPAPQPQ